MYGHFDLMDELYRKDKKHLRPRADQRAWPRWIWKALHTAHPDAGVYQVGPWQVLHSVCCWGFGDASQCCGRASFADHIMISQDSRLVFEPYRTVEQAEIEAEKFAKAHGLQYKVSPVAWWNDGCVRVEFWEMDPDTERIIRTCKYDLADPSASPKRKQRAQRALERIEQEHAHTA